jgi:hypothetical protein
VIFLRNIEYRLVISRRQGSTIDLEGDNTAGHG